MKISEKPITYVHAATAPTQFEYSLPNRTTDRMTMDLSFVDCGPHTNEHVERKYQRTFADCPLRGDGMLAKWRTSECPNTYCEAVDDGNTICKGAYHEPKDDHASKVCVWGDDVERYVDMDFITCPNEKDVNALDPSQDWGMEYYGA